MKFFTKLANPDDTFNIVGHAKRWYITSAVLIAAALLGFIVNGLNLGIEFTGGATFSVTSTQCNVESVRTAATAANVENPTVTQVGDDRYILTTSTVTTAESTNIVNALAKTCAVTPDTISAQIIGGTWGSEITSKALTALVAFLVSVSIFLAIYFEWRMAAAAIVALIHDLFITVGLYALAGFEVTPATVVGFLTILGFSLYDTVVVFDKVKENTRNIFNQNKYTYATAANLALNQTIIRSINTSVVALLPVAAILVIGVGVLGAGTLKDLALALFIGTAVGTYSSLFIATPFLVSLKNRQPKTQELAQRVKNYEEKQAAKQKNNATKPPSVLAASTGGVPSVDKDLTGQSTAKGVTTRKQPVRKTRKKRKKLN